MKKLLIVSLFIILLFSGCNRKYVESPNNVWEEYIKTKYNHNIFVLDENFVNEFDEIESNLLFLLEQRDKGLSNESYDNIARQLIDFRLRAYDRRDEILEEERRQIEQIFSNRNNIINGVIKDLIKFRKFIDYELKNNFPTMNRDLAAHSFFTLVQMKETEYLIYS